ncbi:MAG: Tim44 domain-containing protein [Deltaproteobacteria bacterium]|nr:Tim44 domain-containing protein [Deltaproteobacteria bacterium]
MSRIGKIFGIGLILVFTMAIISSEVWARAGGGRSGGFRGSRSFSAPRTQSPGTSQFQRSTPPSSGFMNRPFSQSTGSPFLRGLAGGVAGGFLGSMLFSGLGHGAMGSGWGSGGGLGGSGFGFLEIILIGVLIFFIFRFIRNRKKNEFSRNAAAAYSPPPYQQDQQADPYAAPIQSPDQEVEAGISHIQSMDQNFDPLAFKDWVQDLFFKIQAAWGNQDLSPIGPFLTSQMNGIFQQDLDGMKTAGRVNRLENIAVRSVDITEAWQEEGKDFITILFYANLLDYTEDKNTGAIVSGSKTEPVKFREFWTFVRPVGSRGTWQLSAIQQEN